MMLVTKDIRARLVANDRASVQARARGEREPDHVPVVRFFNPMGQAIWLATEIDEDGLLFGLADLGFNCPELGSFALDELQSIRLAFGLGIERDICFEGRFPLSVYAAAARRAGSAVLTEQQLVEADVFLRGDR